MIYLQSIGSMHREACTRKGQRGEISQKGTKDKILTSYPGMGLRDGQWGSIFDILEVTKGTNSALGHLRLNLTGCLFEKSHPSALFLWRPPCACFQLTVNISFLFQTLTCSHVLLAVLYNHLFENQLRVWPILPSA